MRLHQILLLAAAAILASADATTSKGKLVTADANDVPTTRVLRAETKVTDEEEERAVSWSFKLPESVTNFFKSGTTSTVTSKIAAQDDQLVQMVRKGDSVDALALKLPDNVDDLLTNANLKRFATYVESVNKANKLAQKPPVTMIKPIIAKYGDAAAARMLNKAKQVESTQKIATDLEGALFNTWLLGSKPKTSKAVFRLLEVNGPHHPDYPIWVAFNKAMTVTRIKS